MDDLVQWLREQIDEDERNAKARRGVFPSPGVDDDGAVWLHIRPGGNAVIVQYRDPVAGYDDMAKLRDWASDEEGWTQERVLREIDAKRRILAVHRPYVPEPDQSCLGCAGGITFTDCPVVRLLALPYSDRTGYREEWRPS